MLSVYLFSWYGYQPLSIFSWLLIFSTWMNRPKLLSFISFLAWQLYGFSYGLLLTLQMRMAGLWSAITQEMIEVELPSSLLLHPLWWWLFIFWPLLIWYCFANAKENDLYWCFWVKNQIEKNWHIYSV